MTITELLSQGRETLENKGIETASLDASVLLAHYLGLSRAGLYASLRDSVDSNIENTFLRAIERRKEGFPLAYITGYKEFMGLSFKVDPRVLIPRPDTEILAEAALEILKTSPRVLKILDLCTGSGCLAVTLSHYFPQREIWATDISPDALEVARFNGKFQTLGKVKFLESNLFQNVPETFDLILTNPPYLLPQETQDCLNQGWEEPPGALDGGGEDGLDLIRELIPQAWDHLNPGGWLLLEAASPQFPELEKLFRTQGFSAVEVLQDLGSRDRIILGQRPGPERL